MYRCATLCLLFLTGFLCLSCSRPVPDPDDTDGPTAAQLQFLDHDWQPVESGPWGTLEYRRFFLPVPKIWLEATSGKEPVAWVIPKITSIRVQELISSGPLTDVEKRLWRETCSVEEQDGNVIIHPSKEFRWMLRPESRSLIYSWLARFDGNPAQMFAFSYPAASLKEWFLHSDLRPALVEAVEHFLYPAENAVCFADLDLLEEFLAAPEERAELLAVLHRQPCCELRLRLDPHSDLGRLAAYWGEWQGVDHVYERLKKAMDTRREPAVSLPRLIPRLPRSLLNTFPPPPRDPAQPMPDCFWTAFNFFNATPDPRFSQASFIEDTLIRQHDAVTDKPRYGDILFLVDGKGRPVHAAVYLAADFVYTKNGGHPTKPWVMMKLADMKAAYPVYGKLRVTYYRWNPEKAGASPSYLTGVTPPAIH